MIAFRRHYCRLRSAVLDFIFHYFWNYLRFDLSVLNLQIQQGSFIHLLHFTDQVINECSSMNHLIFIFPSIAKS